VSDRVKYRMTLARQRGERELAGRKPVPHRITTALNLMGLYGPEVDRALGGEEPMVDQWESGELVPTREQVELLAELTQYPVHYFYIPIKEPGGIGVVCTSDGCERGWVGPPPPPEPLADVVSIGTRTPAGPPDPTPKIAEESHG
jgi:DNA-binding transcriptional regulator YiaG